MPRDPLDTLARVRRLAHEEALAALARALNVEGQADELAKKAERIIAAELAAAGALAGADSVVEACAAGLPGARGAPPPVCGAAPPRRRERGGTGPARPGRSASSTPRPTPWR